VTIVSIAMATYQGSPFIGEQLDSIARQTHPPDELVISDDDSSDETAQIIERFAASAKFAVNLHRNEQTLGFNRNFVRALSLTKGDLIFISDQDDIWNDKKIERVVTAFDERRDCLALIHDERILDQQSGTIFKRTYFGNQRALGFNAREMVSGNCTSLRRELLDILLPFPDDINYDYWIAWIADVLGCRLVLDEALQMYRRHGSNASEPVLAERRPTPWSVLLRTGLPDPKPVWRGVIAQHQLIAGRIAERAGAIDTLLGDGRAQASIDKLARETESLQHRLDLMSLPPLQRRLSVLRHWLQGFYRRFSGAKSAMKDLLQRN
jgi:glycosyltransferase involved in cell wall biosynthesis